MKYFLLFAIQLYWKIIPEKNRRKCLFRESCSHYVYRRANDEGFLSGMRAFLDRIRQCRPGYTIYFDDISNRFELHLKNGQVIDNDQIADRLLAPFYDPF